MDGKDVGNIVLLPIVYASKVKRGIPILFVFQIIFLAMKIYAVTAGVQALNWAWWWVFIPMWIVPALFIGTIVIAGIIALLVLLGYYVHYSIEDSQRKRRGKKRDKN